MIALSRTLFVALMGHGHVTLTPLCAVHGIFLCPVPPCQILSRLHIFQQQIPLLGNFLVAVAGVVDALLENAIQIVSIAVD